MARLWVSDRSPPSADLSIEAIVADAQRTEERVASLAPQDVNLCRVAADIVEAARLAGERTRRMRSPLSLSKIRLYIFILATAMLVWWVYVLVSASGIESASLKPARVLGIYAR